MEITILNYNHQSFFRLIYTMQRLNYKIEKSSKTHKTKKRKTPNSGYPLLILYLFFIIVSITLQSHPYLT